MADPIPGGERRTAGRSPRLRAAAKRARAKRCTKCAAGGSRCLAAARSESPPAGVLDFAERSIRLVFSCRGSWTAVCQLLVLILVPLAGVVAAVALAVRLAGPGWAGALGGVSAAIGIGVAFYRRARQTGSPAVVTEAG